MGCRIVRAVPGRSVAASVHARMSSSSALPSVRSPSQPCTARAATACPRSRAARNSSTAADAACSGPRRRSPTSVRACCSSASPATRSPQSKAAAPRTIRRVNRSGGDDTTGPSARACADRDRAWWASLRRSAA
jgi:hypothetical protein